MIKRTLAELAALCGGQIANVADSNIAIEGVITDSRTISQGCLFVPLVGERFDGHKFAQECLQAGASAVLWEKGKGTPPGPSILVDNTLEALQQLAKAYLAHSEAKVIGITGSNGKTTTKDLVYSLLSTTYKVHKTQGNYNNHIGLPLTILSMPEDTDIIVLEMGMSGRHEIELLSSLANPETAVITNIGESHLLQLGSRLEIARAKLEILSGMKDGGLLIYPGNEPLVTEVLSESTTVKPIHLRTSTFGIGGDNDDYPSGIMYADGKTFFTSHVSGNTTLELPLLGEHNVINCLAALTVARHYGVSIHNIVEGLRHLELTGMRIEVIHAENGITILNDAYNASPTSMKAAISVLESMKGGRKKIAVLGDMLELGDAEEEYHREVGAYLSSNQIDYLFTYGKLGRYIADGAQNELDADHIFAYYDKSELIAQLESMLYPKDIVLIKGSRGMKLEEVVDAIKSSNIHK